MSAEEEITPEQEQFIRDQVVALEAERRLAHEFPADEPHDVGEAEKNESPTAAGVHFDKPEPETLASAAPAGGASSLSFLRGDVFLRADYPTPEVLLGDGDEKLFTRGSLLIVYGDGGSGKSTLTIDGVAHMAAGKDWLGMRVSRPVRFVVIENESGQGLFQGKLQAKAAKSSSWGEDDSWLENVYVYVEPWGAFSFARPETRAALREFCLENAVDVVVANPLFGVGASGAGKPEETGAFIKLLKEVGLDAEIAFWLLHHVNKMGDVSGDWRRHPDTIIRLERDGDQPRTVLRWIKTRWATTPSETRPVKQFLDWVVEHQGYELLEIDPSKVAGEELYRRLDEFLAANPGSNTTACQEGPEGNEKRLGELVKAGAASGRYIAVRGPKNSTLYSLKADGEIAPRLDLSAEEGGTE